MKKPLPIAIEIKDDDVTLANLQATLVMGGLGLWELALSTAGLEGAAVLFSKSFMRHLGCDGGDFPKTVAEFFDRHVHPDDLEELRRGIRKCVDGSARPYRQEHRLRNAKTGEWRWYSSFGDISAFHSSGSPLRLSGAIQDIHERRLAEEQAAAAERDRAEADRALSRERERLSAVIDAADLGVWEWNVKTGMVAYSQGWADMVGYTLEELGDDTSVWDKIFIPDEMNEAMEILAAHSRGELPRYLADFRLRHKNGTMVWAQGRGRVVETDAEGWPVRVVGLLIDFTKQRRAELALLDNLGLQERMLDDSAVGSWVWQIPADRVDVSDVYLEQLGYKRGEFGAGIGDWLLVIHPDERDIATRSLERLLTGEDRLYACELRMRHKEGHYVQIYDIGRVEERDAYGRPVRFVGAHYDTARKARLEQSGCDMLAVIAEQKRALEAQMQSRTRVLDEVGKRLARLTSLHGADDESELSRAMTGADRPPAALAEDARSDEFADYVIRAVDYITKRMHWYLTVVNTIPFPIHVVDNEMRWLFLNSASLASFPGGRSALGSPCGGADICRTDRCIKRRLEQGESKFVATALESGRVFQGCAAFLNDENGKRIGHVQVMQDITEIKEKEKELLLARDAAQASAKAKSEFLANMSHEVRTPMNAVLGLCHLLLQHDLTDVQYDYVRRIESAAKSLLRIINDILDFSKIEAGKMDLVPEEFSLESTIRSSVDLLADRAHLKGLEFILDIPPTVPDSLVGDPARLGQVLTNLISNAVKFTEKGEVSLGVKAVEQSPDSVVLSFVVRDTGAGLTKDQSALIFNAFTQVDNSASRRYGGTGLGLAISKRLAELMGGMIWCDSVYGQGSVFGFTARFGLRQNGDAEPAAVERSLRGLRVLAVDDNPTCREVLRKMLRAMGFVVRTAASGDEALVMLEDMDGGERFDLLLVDWKMPGMDGMETIRRMNRTAAAAKLPAIVMTTAYNRAEILPQAKAEGVRAVVTKPISSSSLLNAIMDTFGKTSRASTKRVRGGENGIVAHLKGVRVLLAEDNEVNQLVAGSILKNAGLVVDIAPNGRRAVEMLLSGEYALVLMDIQMPDMDGFEATRLIRSRPEFGELPIIAMTANAMAGDREASLKAGMNDHVSKPIDVPELFRTLARWLPGDSS